MEFTNEMKEEFTKLQMKIVFDDYSNEKVTMEEFNRYLHLQKLSIENEEENLQIEEDEDFTYEINSDFLFDDYE